MWFDSELFEIFSWLPAHDLYKFSAVSKSSNKLLSESFFVKKQCKNMRLVPEDDFFIQPDYFQWCSSHQLEAHKLNANDSNKMPRESLEFLTEQGPIIASNNGLLCLRRPQSNDKPLCLFNPTTKNCLQIPNPCERSNFESSYNVVLDCCTSDEGEYLLMVLENPPEFGSSIYSSMIYSPELGMWRDGGKVDLGQRRMIFEYSVKENEIAYMISDNSNYLAKQSPFYWPYIVAYDIKNSTSKFLSLPKRARKGLLDDSTIVRIFRWVDLERLSICLVKLRNKVFTMWVLSEEDKWTCTFNMRVKALTSSGDDKVAGFTVMNGSVLLFATADKVYLYDLKHGNYGESKQVCTHNCGDMVQLRSCSSTLRSCGSGSTTLLPSSSSRKNQRKGESVLNNKIYLIVMFVIFCSSLMYLYSN